MWILTGHDVVKQKGWWRHFPFSLLDMLHLVQNYICVNIAGVKENLFFSKTFHRVLATTVIWFKNRYQASSGVQFFFYPGEK